MSTIKMNIRMAIVALAALLCTVPAMADDWDRLYGALYTSMWGGDDTKLAQLLDQGLDIDTQNGDGWTLLHYAASNGKIGQLKMLLNRGADPTLKTISGKTPFDVTSSAQVKRLLAQALATKGSAPTEKAPEEIWAEARWAIEYNQGEELARLLDSGLGVNTASSRDGWTLLMIAAWKGDLKMVQFLTSRGADKSARNNKGETAAQLTFDPNVRAYLGGTAKPQPVSNTYCTRMYHEATRLCDMGSAGSFCRMQAANKTQQCNKTGRWP